MNKLLSFLLFLGLALSTHASNDIKIMTFNIRLDTKSDSLNAWTYRKDNVSKMLNYYAPDILGTQEVLHNQLIDITKMLPQYSYVGVGRSDGKEKGEYSSLFFNKERFELMKSGTFGLSEQPDKIGKKGWDAACERIVTWAILKDKKTEKEIAVFNTHFDHEGQIARRESSKLLLSKINEIAGKHPVIVTGDFNGTPDSEPIRILTENNNLKDTRNIAAIAYGPNNSFHNFGRLDEKKRTLIDYIFIKGDLSVKKHRIIEDRNEGFLSDHNPVEAIIEI